MFSLRQSAGDGNAARAVAARAKMKTQQSAFTATVKRRTLRLAQTRASPVADNVQDDLDPSGMRRADHVRQVGHATPVWRQLIKILRSVAVERGATDIIDDGGHPDSGRPERLDVVELLLDALQVAAVDGMGVSR